MRLWNPTSGIILPLLQFVLAPETPPIAAHFTAHQTAQATHPYTLDVIFHAHLKRNLAGVYSAVAIAAHVRYGAAAEATKSHPTHAHTTDAHAFIHLFSIPAISAALLLR